MPRPRRKVTFEKVSEDENGAVYHVEAIHATTTLNNRKYSEQELQYGARSLSGRPINYNHDEGRWLDYDYKNKFGPDSNSTIFMEYDPIAKGIVGTVWVSDKDARINIESGNIKTVSIEQTPVKGESCSCMLESCTCEQHGIVFDAIAILETYKGVLPGDPGAKIRKNARDEMKRKSKEEESAEPEAVGDDGGDDKDDKEDDSKDDKDADKDKPKKKFGKDADADDDKDKDKKEDDGDGDKEECPEGKHLVDGKCVPIDKEDADDDDLKDKKDKDADKEEESCGCIETQFMRWAEAYLRSMKLA